MKKILLLLFLGSYNLMATSYGLIIGIGTYKNKNIISLPNIDKDIETYKTILKQKNVENIYILRNKEATKTNILDKLSYISNKVKKGDRFFMFYSGHGTDANGQYSELFKELNLSHWIEGSGAILPYNFDSSIQNFSNSIIIGKRDLRDHLTNINQKVKNSLIVFDACFSRDSTKGIKKKLSKNKTPRIITEDSRYPYNHIVYIASSVIEAEPGTFSPILETCLKNNALPKIKACINMEIKDTIQRPAIISGDVITLE